MSIPARQLVIRADDAGSFPQTNEAIVLAASRGWPLNVGFMAPGPCFRDAADRLKGFKNVCCGLHLTFTSEWTHQRFGPLSSRMNRYCDAPGRFFPEPGKIHQAGVVLEDLLAEARAQLDFARSAGLNIEYMDEHMGFAWIHPPGAPNQRFASLLKDLCSREGLVWHADKPLSCWPGPTLDPGSILSTLSPCQGNVLLLLHPSIDRGEMTRDWVRIGADSAGVQSTRRQKDLDLLLHPDFPAHVKASGFEPARYTQVPSHVA